MFIRIFHSFQLNTTNYCLLSIAFCYHRYLCLIPLSATEFFLHSTKQNSHHPADLTRTSGFPPCSIHWSLKLSRYSFVHLGARDAGMSTKNPALQADLSKGGGLFVITRSTMDRKCCYGVKWHVYDAITIIWICIISIAGAARPNNASRAFDCVFLCA